MHKISKKISVAFLSLVFVFSLALTGLAATTTKPSYFLIEGHLLTQTIKNINSLLVPLKLSRNTALEAKQADKYVRYLVIGTSEIGDNEKPLVFFVTYGTPSTKSMLPSERSGVLNSYQRAFKKLPITDNEWADVIRIARDTKPLDISLNAEDRAKLDFRTAFGRQPVLPSDQHALDIMAYGLTPITRNLALEQKALVRFTNVFNHLPVFGADWNMVRAYAYGGVK